MEALMKSRVSLITSTFSAVKHSRRYKGDSSRLIFPRLEIPKNFQVEKLVWMKYCSLIIAKYNFKELLLKELIQECHLQKATNHNYERILILNSSIDCLIKNNFIKSWISIIDSFLSYVEPFPFDREQIKSYVDQNKNRLSVKQIRNEIERQYLAWKFNVDVKSIKNILNIYNVCLYDYRSLENLCRNVKTLESFNGVEDLSIAERIYYINQTPFSLDYVCSFKRTLSELEWKIFPYYCPKILCHSHQIILFIISTLKDMNFSRKQIQEGLPVLHFSFVNLIRKLNFLLSDPDTVKYRNEDEFLLLLAFPTNAVLKDFIATPNVGFKDLLHRARIYSRNIPSRTKYCTAKTILKEVNQFFKIDGACLRTIKKHPKYRFISVSQIHDTLKFLKDCNFTNEELEESITIVLYPRSSIEKALLELEVEGNALQSYGFRKGCVEDVTKLFRKGTKEKRKTLQLCLYYMEKQYHFSGDGVWGLEAKEMNASNVEKADYALPLD